MFTDRCHVPVKIQILLVRRDPFLARYELMILLKSCGQKNFIELHWCPLAELLAYINSSEI